MAKHADFPVEVVNLDGGRKSGKSLNVALFLAKAMCVVDEKEEWIKTSAIVIKKQANSLPDVWEEYTAMTKDELIVPKTKISWMRWNYPNGNYVKFKAWVDKEGRKQGAGWSSLEGEYVFIILEEAYEFSAKDRQDIREAIRAKNKNAKILTFCICNPWQPLNPYIQMLDQYLPYNVKELRNKGYQFKIQKVNELRDVGIVHPDYKPETHLFIHTNWRINNFLSKTDINSITLVWKYNKPEAPTTDFGMPGYSEQFCYGANLQNIQDAIFEPKKCWVCGGDEGLGGKASGGKTSFTFAGYNPGEYLDIYDLYVWDNHSYEKKTANEIAVEVVDFYINNRNRYYDRTGITIDLIEVRVDKCAIAFINQLNHEAEKRGITWLNFISCSKRPINDRIMVLNCLLYDLKFRLDKSRCQPLIEELSQAVWDDKGQKPKRKDKNDHSINAMEYGFEPVMNLMFERNTVSKSMEYLGYRKMFKNKRSNLY